MSLGFWIALAVVALIAFWLSPLCPTYTRNHDGDELRLWLGRVWIRSREGEAWERIG